MNDYISREALKELFDGIYDCSDLVFEPDDQICAKQHSSCGSCRWLETKRAIQKRVMSLPAADVRPVVRCRDCMYAPLGTDDGEDQGFALEWPYDEWPEDNPCPCKCEDGWYSHKPKPDFFCANGRRKKS